jgi:hypothetical protein
MEGTLRICAISLAAGVALASLSLAEVSRAQSSSAAPSAATPIGKVVTAKGVVSIEHGDAVILQANLPANDAQGKVGDLVFKGDTVSTGADGAIGITFTDGTAFNLSSNARMVLNEFVYDPNGKSNSTFFSLSKGTFTFVAGKVARTGDMKIDTPVATMGIRGTTPHVEISSDGTVTFNTLIEDKKAIDKTIGVAPNGPNKKQRRTAANPGTPVGPNGSTSTNGPASPNGAATAVQVEKKPAAPTDMKLDSSSGINIRICDRC